MWFSGKTLGSIPSARERKKRGKKMKRERARKEEQSQPNSQPVMTSLALKTLVMALSDTRNFKGDPE